MIILDNWTRRLVWGGFVTVYVTRRKEGRESSQIGQITTAN